VSRSTSPPHGLPDDAPARFVVGIDLGTTNSAVGFVDTHRSPWRVEVFEIPQLVAPGQVEARATLPSFHYEAAPGELAGDALRLPWSQEPTRWTVGVFARDHGALAPGRLVASAKSWLCHSGVDRTAGLLPWQGAADVERLSPIEASSRYLLHIRQAWDAARPEHPLPEQDVVLTLPASFDEVARQLTVKAAARAGLTRVVLIEEPQAAFYAWIDRHRDDWESHVAPGQTILVCDCGGGTSDFTLIRVRRGEAGKVQFHRVAVGEHLILGGDNLDLALAHHLEARLGGRLAPRAWSVLVRVCRQTKETLLADDAPERTTVNLPGTGAKLIGGARQIEVGRDEVRELLVDGFFARTKLTEKPARRRSGFQEFGLPYAPDPAITRYLAAFLCAHGHSTDDESSDGASTEPAAARPDLVLFNGGLFESQVIRTRLLEVLGDWFAAADPAWQPRVLESSELHLAVARGAAYFGMVRRGEGVRIAAGLARTYYLGLESGKAESGEQEAESGKRKAEGEGPDIEDQAAEAVCLVPASAEPGQEIDLAERRFELLVARPVEFPLFVSSTRLADRPGELVPVNPEQMTPLPPIRTVLRKRKKSDPDSVTIQLHARLTEIGTLDLWCGEVQGPGRWRLEFDVRSATQTDVAAHESAAEAEGFLDESILEACDQRIREVFAPEGRGKPGGLVRELVDAVGAGRGDWPTSLLRRLWETLLRHETGRRRSEAHESRWLNLVGFALRPGYGLGADDWRVGETWRALHGRLYHPTPACRAEWWILWRRIAGGLPAGQQQALADPLLGPLRAMHRQLTTGRGRGGELAGGSHETAEVLRLLGSLEWLSVPTKVELGDMLLDVLPKPKMESVRPAIAWAVGRLGARQPLYGPLNTVVPVEASSRWLDRLMQSGPDDPMTLLSVMQLARRTLDRYRDVSEKSRKKVLAWLAAHNAPPHYAALVQTVGRLDAEEEGLVFGESLPKGLRMA